MCLRLVVSKQRADRITGLSGLGTNRLERPIAFDPFRFNPESPVILSAFLHRYDKDASISDIWPLFTIRFLPCRISSEVNELGPRTSGSF